MVMTDLTFHLILLPVLLMFQQSACEIIISSIHINSEREKALKTTDSSLSFYFFNNISVMSKFKTEGCLINM